MQSLLHALLRGEGGRRPDEVPFSPLATHQQHQPANCKRASAKSQDVCIRIKVSALILNCRSNRSAISALRLAWPFNTVLNACRVTPIPAARSVVLRPPGSTISLINQRPAWIEIEGCVLRAIIILQNKIWCDEHQATYDTQNSRHSRERGKPDFPQHYRIKLCPTTFTQARPVFRHSKHAWSEAKQVIWNPAFSQHAKLAATKAGYQIAHSATLRFPFGMTEFLCITPAVRQRNKPRSQATGPRFR